MLCVNAHFCYLIGKIYQSNLQWKRGHTYLSKLARVEMIHIGFFNSYFPLLYFHLSLKDATQSPLLLGTKVCIPGIVSVFMYVYHVVICKQTSIWSAAIMWYSCRLTTCHISIMVTRKSFMILIVILFSFRL